MRARHRASRIIAALVLPAWRRATPSLLTSRIDSSTVGWTCSGDRHLVPVDNGTDALEKVAVVDIIVLYFFGESSRCNNETKKFDFMITQQFYERRTQNYTRSQSRIFSSKWEQNSDGSCGGGEHFKFSFAAHWSCVTAINHRSVLFWFLKLRLLSKRERKTNINPLLQSCRCLRD